VKVIPISPKAPLEVPLPEESSSVDPLFHDGDRFVSIWDGKNLLVHPARRSSRRQEDPVLTLHQYIRCWVEPFELLTSYTDFKFTVGTRSNFDRARREYFMMAYGDERRAQHKR
jgi:hypothetical protein